jgi:hypothetical protein
MPDILSPKSLFTIFSPPATCFQAQSASFFRQKVGKLPFVKKTASSHPQTASGTEKRW